MLDVIATALWVAAIAAIFAAQWRVLKVLDERRGKHLSAVRLVLNPLMINPDDLTEKGRRHHKWAVRLFCVAIACVVLSIVVGRF